MKRYTFTFASGRELVVDAEGDDAKSIPGLVILFKKKDLGGVVLRTDEKAHIVRIISAHQLEEYGSVDLDG